MSTKDVLMKSITEYTAARLLNDRIASVCRAAELLADEVGELVTMADGASIHVSSEIADLPSDLQRLRNEFNRIGNLAYERATLIHRGIVASEKASAEELIASLSPAALIQLIKEKA